MKNANVFIDVDLTLVDANGKLLSGAREALSRLKDEGCHLFLWSTCVTSLVYNVHQVTSWLALAEKIIAKHID